MKKIIYHPGVGKPDRCKFRNARNIVRTHIFQLTVCIFIVESAIECLSINEHDFRGMSERKETKQIPKTRNNVYFTPHKNIPKTIYMSKNPLITDVYFKPHKNKKIFPKQSSCQKIHELQMFPNSTIRAHARPNSMYIFCGYIEIF